MHHLSGWLLSLWLQLCWSVIYSSLRSLIKFNPFCTGYVKLAGAQPLGPKTQVARLAMCASVTLALREVCVLCVRLDTTAHLVPVSPFLCLFAVVVFIMRNHFLFVGHLACGCGVGASSSGCNSTGGCTCRSHFSDTKCTTCSSTYFLNGTLCSCLNSLPFSAL